MPGGGELVIIAVIAIAVLFGAKKLPEMARSVGRSKGEFSKGLREGALPEDKEQPPPAAAPATAPQAVQEPQPTPPPAAAPAPPAAQPPAQPPADPAPPTTQNGTQN
jgi:sec-independent protein translocase protein TatA